MFILGGSVGRLIAAPPHRHLFSCVRTRAISPAGALALNTAYFLMGKSRFYSVQTVNFLRVPYSTPTPPTLPNRSGRGAHKSSWPPYYFYTLPSALSLDRTSRTQYPITFINLLDSLTVSGYFIIYCPLLFLHVYELNRVNDRVNWW